MEKDLTKRSTVKVDWRWVGVGFCFFVVFHLLPSYVIIGFFTALFNPVRTPSFLAAVYNFGLFSQPGLGKIGAAFWLSVGPAIVGMYIGYRSRGVTILEPGISALFYTLVLFFSIPKIWEGQLAISTVSGMFAWIASAFVAACIGAWIGELLQARKQRVK